MKNYIKPCAVKINKDELSKLIKIQASNSCGAVGCERVWAGSKDDCTDVYHDACLDESKWTAGECQYGSWLDSAEESI